MLQEVCTSLHVDDSPSCASTHPACMRTLQSEKGDRRAIICIAFGVVSQTYNREHTLAVVSARKMDDAFAHATLVELGIRLEAGL